MREMMMMMQRKRSSSSSSTTTTSRKRIRKLGVIITITTISLFIVFSFFVYNTSDEDGVAVLVSSSKSSTAAAAATTSTTFVQPNLPSTTSSSSVLDRFTKCNSTREYTGKKIQWFHDDDDDDDDDDQLKHTSSSSSPSSSSSSSSSCDVFDGKWVYDNSSYPLYEESACPYMSDQLACHKHGRLHLTYQHWRWQPHACNLNTWTVLQAWEKLRGKRLMFVGDSLNRGQWISMVCLLQSVIPPRSRSMSPNAHLTVFRAHHYNATIEFLWAPLLVDSNSDDPVNHRLDERIIRPDSVLKHSSLWQHADILVFNSYLWWRQGPVKLL